MKRTLPRTVLAAYYSIRCNDKLLCMYVYNDDKLKYVCMYMYMYVLVCMCHKSINKPFSHPPMCTTSYVQRKQYLTACRDDAGGHAAG